MGGSVLDDSLGAIGPGKSAFRSWFFQQLATSGGARDWSAFDRTLATARARGVKVIATLIDQWGNCGSSVPGGYKDASWYEGGYRQPDPAGIVSYRDWVGEIVRRYKDDPTILAWQLVNEPEVLLSQGGDCGAVPESTAEADLKAFAADVSGLIKSIDANHLVSLGTLGSGQCGAQGADYQDVMSVPSLDLCEYHDYQPTDPIPGDQWNGLQVRLDQCNALQKPLVVGEVGIKPSDVGGTFAARAQTLQAKLWAQFNAGVVGELAWAWDKDGSTLDNYDIGPGDPALDVLAVTPAPNSAKPGVGVADVAVVRPDAGTTVVNVPVSLSWQSASSVSVHYATANSTAKAGSDYVATSGTVTFAAGETTKTVPVTVNGDPEPTLNLKFSVKLTAPVGAVVSDAAATVTLVNAHGPMTIAVGDAFAVAGPSASLSFPVTLSAPVATGHTVSVHYATANGTATAGTDYTATSGNLTFTAGQQSKTVTFQVLDTTVSANKTLKLTLTTPVGATLADASATGTITNATVKPGVGVSDVAVVRPDAGTTVANVPLSLSWQSTSSVSVHYATVNGTAKAGSGYVATSGTVTFAAGETTKTVPVTVNGDPEPTLNLKFSVKLTAPVGAVVSDAAATVTLVNAHGPMTIAVGDAFAVAGPSASLSFPVTLSAPVATGHTVSVHYATANGTATAGTDYTATSGNLTFSPGDQYETVTVAVLDTTVSANKTLKLTLTTPVGATLADASATGTITNS